MSDRHGYLGGLVIFGLAACGGGNAAPALPVPPAIATSNLPPAGVRSTAVTVSGPIENMIPGGFTVYAGPPVGDIHVFTGGSTVEGGRVAPGSYAQATGNGSLASSIRARFVGVYRASPGPASLAGSVARMLRFGFILDSTAAHRSVPIVLNAATIVGGSPLVSGASVTISGVGSANVGVLAKRITVATPTPSPGSSPTPTPVPIAMTHVLTMDYLGGKDGTRSIGWKAAAPYLSWAETSASDADDIHDAGIETAYYIDPNRTQPGEALHTSDESTYAHDCSGNRVTDTYKGNLTQYVMNPASPALRALFAVTMASVASRGHFDAVWEDDAGALLDFAPYTPFSALPCNYTNAEWIAGGLALNLVTSVPIMFNGLSGLDGHGLSLSTSLLAGPNTIGGTYEGCYSSSAQPKMNGWLWLTIENTELYAARQGKTFSCLQVNENPANSQVDARVYAYASFLLTYDPLRDILWETYSTPSRFHVMPESELVALDPVVSEPSDVRSLQLTGGAYGREFSRCYIHGAFAGACAAVVNPSAQAVPLPFVRYRHCLVLSGSGVLDGGTVSTLGSARNTIAPNEAAILFP
jgi:hypothetical protein